MGTSHPVHMYTPKLISNVTIVLNACKRHVNSWPTFSLMVIALSATSYTVTWQWGNVTAWTASAHHRTLGVALIKRCKTTSFWHQLIAGGYMLLSPTWPWRCHAAPVTWRFAVGNRLPGNHGSSRADVGSRNSSSYGSSVWELAVETVVLPQRSKLNPPKWEFRL